MAWQVLITDNALADLREIVEFIAQDDPQAAERMGNRLVARVLNLATMRLVASANFPCSRFSSSIIATMPHREHPALLARRPPMA